MKRTVTTESLAGYLARMRELPFVRAVRLGPKGLVVTTPDGKFELEVELTKTHLDRAHGQALIARQERSGRPILLAAPIVGAELGGALAAASVNFLDLDGNCFLNLDDKFIARIQRSARPVRVSQTSAMRAPGYQVLLGLLGDEQLQSATVRTLAAATGVSVAPAHQLRGRLVEQGLAWRDRQERFHWFPERWDEALAMFVSGYASSLRGKLLVGRYRTSDAAPDACEKRLEKVLGSGEDWAFGGGSAAARLTGHYHGPHTTVHMAAPSPQVLRALRAVPDRDGPMLILRSPGPVGLRGPSPHLAHPLLVYAELLHEGGERAREAASEILERWKSSWGHRS